MHLTRQKCKNQTYRRNCRSRQKFDHSSLRWIYFTMVLTKWTTIIFQNTTISLCDGSTLNHKRQQNRSTYCTFLWKYINVEYLYYRPCYNNIIIDIVVNIISRGIPSLDCFKQTFSSNHLLPTRIMSLYLLQFFSLNGKIHLLYARHKYNRSKMIIKNGLCKWQVPRYRWEKCSKRKKLWFYMYKIIYTHMMWWDIIESEFLQLKKIKIKILTLFLTPYLYANHYITCYVQVVLFKKKIIK